MKTIKVVAAVIRRGDKVFATQRGYGDYKDWWEFPGGKLEAGESPEEALVREIREELNTVIAVDEFLTTVEYDYPEFHLSMDCFWCRVEEGQLTLLEHEAARWLPMGHLRQVAWLPADILVIEEIERQCDRGTVPVSHVTEGLSPCHITSSSTIQYYDMHAKEFCAGTINADMRDCRERFLKYLEPGQKILDAGCGSGRDIIAFKEAGYEVDAFDASAELCGIASQWTGIPVRHMYFEELQGQDQYDGIWACASLLHVARENLQDVLARLHQLLKENGVIYASFKYGNGERCKDGRYFVDFTEKTAAELFTSAGFVIKEIFVTRDVRKEREGEKWVNIIATVKM